MRYGLPLPFLLAAVFLLGLAPGQSAGVYPAADSVPDAREDPPHTFGDVDCQGVVDAVDVLFVLRSFAAISPPAACLRVGDVDCDGDVDAVDALGLLRHAAVLPPLPGTAGCPDIGMASLRVLTLDKFGEGHVASDLTGFGCELVCSTWYAVLPSGARVNLTPSAGAGSRFSHWSGCDSTAGDACTVKLDTDKIVLATFALTDVQVPATTKVIDQAPVSIQGNVYCFDSAALDGLTLEPGDSVVSVAGGGYLRKVTSIAPSVPEVVCAETAEATLEDAIARGTLVSTAAAGALTGQASVYPRAGVSCDIAELRCTVPLSVDLAQGLNISGDLTFDADPDLAISFDGFDLGCVCFPVREARAAVTVKGNANLRAFVGVDLSATKETTIPVAHATTVVLVGPVPVVIGYDLGVTVGITGSATAGVESAVKIDSALTVGAHYLRGSGWSPITGASRNLDYTNPAFTAAAQVKVYLKPVISVKVYEVAGPYFGVEGFLRLNVTPLQSPLWKLSAGIGAEAGIEVGAFGITIADYSIPIFEREWVLAQGDTPSPTASPSSAPTRTPTPTPSPAPPPTPTPAPTPVPTPPPSGCPQVWPILALWHFDEGGGDTASDSSGNGHDGAISGAARTAGRAGGGLSFDGVDDYVNVPDSVGLDGMTSLCVEAWVYTRTYPSASVAGIVDKWGPGGVADDSYRLSIDSGGYAHFAVSDGNQGGQTEVTSPVMAPLNAWVQLTGTYQAGGLVRLYMNRDPVISAAATTTYIQNTTQPVRVGRGQSAPAETLDGAIDEVRIAGS